MQPTIALVFEDFDHIVAQQLAHNGIVGARTTTQVNAVAIHKT